MKKRILQFTIFLLLIFSLSGCVNQQYQIKVEENGSAKFGLKVTIDTDSYEALDVYNINVDDFNSQEIDNEKLKKFNPLFRETASVFLSRGFLVDPIEDAVEIGIKIEKDYPSIKDLNEDLEKLNKDSIISLKLKMGIDKSSSKTLYKTVGELKFTTDKEFNNLYEKIKDIETPLDISKLNTSIYIKTPGDLVATTGQPDRGYMMWKTNMEEDTPIEIKYATQIEDKKIEYIIYGVYVVVGAIIIFFIAKFIIKKIKSKKEEDFEDEEEDDEDENQDLE